GPAAAQRALVRLLARGLDARGGRGSRAGRRGPLRRRRRPRRGGPLQDRAAAREQRRGRTAGALTAPRTVLAGGCPHVGRGKAPAAAYRARCRWTETPFPRWQPVSGWGWERAGSGRARTGTRAQPASRRPWSGYARHLG